MEKILLILESEDTRELLSRGLSGYEIATCEACDAYVVLSRFRPDALVLDLSLPGTNGLTLMENCREVLPPVVLPLAVHVDDFVWMKAIRLGAGFVISKPCAISYIVNCLTEMLALCRDTRLWDVGAMADCLLQKFRLHAKDRVLSAIRAGIIKTVREPDCQLMKEIYPQMCLVYDGSQGAVEKAILRALQDAWDRRHNNAEIWNTLFPGYTECPTNGDFILTLARYLRKKYESRSEDIC